MFTILAFLTENVRFETCMDAVHVKKKKIAYGTEKKFS